MTLFISAFVLVLYSVLSFIVLRFCDRMEFSTNTGYKALSLNTITIALIFYDMLIMVEFGRMYTCSDAL